MSDNQNIPKAVLTAVKTFQKQHPQMTDDEALKKATEWYEKKQQQNNTEMLQLTIRSLETEVKCLTQRLRKYEPEFTKCSIFELL